MKDDGTGGDEWSGDGTYAVQMPANLQTHRRLVRYRITATDSNSYAITVPYADDPQPNFAYFVYDGVPAWTGAAQPGTTTNMTFGTNVMRKLPVCHLISKNSDVEACTWPKNVSGYPTNVNFWADTNLWKGTLVYDGKVYDHIGYRPRGGIWRWSMGKNMWKFRFNRGHFVELEDDWGSNYDVKRDTLNFSACIQQGNFLHRGEHGLFEAVGFRLFELAGTPAPKTHWVHYRIIDDASETGATQYDGDFWGLYLSVEHVDGSFLDEHDLPDGNVYKMEGVTNGLTWHAGELSHMGPTGPNDWTDLDFFRESYMTNSNEGWWRSNVNVSAYYSFRAIADGIHHYDIGSGKNYYYYRNPVVVTNQWGTNLLWTMLPWDLDLTWADNMWDCGNLGLSPFKQYGPFTNPATTVNIEFKNKIREIRDLLFNTDQAYSLIDQYAAVIHDPAGGPSFIDADMAQWDYNPTLTNMTRLDTSNTGGNPNTKAGHGRFYESAATRDFPGMVNLMKDYIVYRISYTVDVMSADSNIPNTPTVTATTTNFYADKLTFQTSTFSDTNGNGTFASMQWRIGEITDTNSLTFDPAQSRKYEIESDWESAEISNFTSTVTIPAGVARVGHTYRVRCKMKDNTGRWSHWSDPVQFTSGDTEAGAMLAQNLRVTELMYNPAPGDYYEFIELHNTNASLTLSLTGVTFTAGIDYAFTNGTNILPNGYLLLVRDTNSTFATFRSYYGLGAGVPIAGPYSGKLADGGEQITMKSASAGTVLFSANYGGRNWSPAADGAGHSLVPLVMDCQTNGAMDYWGSWRPSSYIKGSPGSADPARPATNVVINEIMAHTDYTNPPWDSDDWIELYNTLSTNFTFGNNWYLSDDGSDLKKWAIPATNVVLARKWRVFSEILNFHNPITSGFGLSKFGDRAFLSYLPGTASDRVVDCVDFDGQESDKSCGRYPDGGEYWNLMTITRDAQNALWPTQEVTISEVMYHPLPTLANPENNRNDEYVELYNPSSQPVPLTTPSEGGPWKLNGDAGFTFPSNTTIPAGGYIAVVSFDPTNATCSNAFVTAYGITSGQVRIVGPYEGQLNNAGGSVRLERPVGADFAGDSMGWCTVDEATYYPRTPWPDGSDGTGRSFQRKSGRNMPGIYPENWSVSFAPTPGYAPAKISITSPIIGTGYLTPFSVLIETSVDYGVVSGSVLRVEFFDGATLLGTDSVAPYEHLLNTITTAGAHPIKANLVDAAGTNMSPAVTLNVYTNAPDGDAGRDRKINTNYQGFVNLEASMNYNGISPAQVTTSWSQFSGPGSVSFGSASSLDTTATFTTPGTYVLRLTTTYNELTFTDYMTVVVMSTNTFNQIPYRQSFEGYMDGDDLAGLDGWNAASIGIAMVASNNYTNTYSGGFPITTNHQLLLQMTYSASNLFSGTQLKTNVWLDLIMQCTHINETNLPEVDSDCQLALCVHSNGHVVVWNRQASTGTWTELPDTSVGTNEYVRLTANIDYNNRDGSGYPRFRLWIEGAAVTNPTVWFTAASKDRYYFSQLATAGLLKLDDVVVEDHDIVSQKKITAASGPHGVISPSGEIYVPVNGSATFYMVSNTWCYVSGVLVDGGSVGAVTNYTFSNVTADHTISATFGEFKAANNTPKWWLAQWYPTNNFDAAATSDSDGDGMKAWEEYICGTHPTNGASVFACRIVWTNGQIEVQCPTLLAGSEYDGKSRYYSIESLTNLLGEIWTDLPGYLDIYGTGQNLIYTNGSPSGKTYYRGRLKLE